MGCWEGDLSHLVHKCPGVAASGLHQAGDPEDEIPELCDSGKVWDSELELPWDKTLGNLRRRTGVFGIWEDLNFGAGLWQAES